MNELTSEEERDSIEQQIIDLNVKVNEREEEKKRIRL